MKKKAAKITLTFSELLTNKVLFGTSLFCPRLFTQDYLLKTILLPHCWKKPHTKLEIPQGT
jgi:hypothetical protein